MAPANVVFKYSHANDFLAPGRTACLRIWFGERNRFKTTPLSRRCRVDLAGSRRGRLYLFLVSHTSISSAIAGLAEDSENDSCACISKINFRGFHFFQST
jgi:hypothetical protein